MYSWTEEIQNRLGKINPLRVYRAKTGIARTNSMTATNTLSSWVSNDYLGLSQHKQVIASCMKASQHYGVGSTGAPTLGGYTAVHQQLALQLAAFLGFEKCILFNSGYQLAFGIFSQLADVNTTIWLDKNVHASHIDGILLSKSKFISFTASSLDTVISQIKSQHSRRHIVLTEATFSMDGTCSYLDKLLLLKQEQPNNILLLIDDAHGVGALGENGLGTFEQLKLNLQQVDLLIGTLGKAFGCHGGFIAGSTTLIDYLQQTVRSLLFSTYLPPSIAAAASTSLSIIKNAEGRRLRQNLMHNIRYFGELARLYNLPLYQAKNNISPIQLLVFNDEQIVIKIFDALLCQNMQVGRILYPTVAKTGPRIRISLHAAHSQPEIHSLCLHLHKLVSVYA